MSYQTDASEGEAPQTSCSVCLETWNSSDRVPKFLICHHSICVTCAGELQRTAKKKRTKPSAELSDGGQQQHLSASRESLGSLNSTLDEKTKETPSWVRCPMCRTRTFIEDPYLLQTNFYLRGLPRSTSMPRLVLWCDTCSMVAAPDCGEHILRPVGEKMRSLQEELIRRTDALQGHVNESLGAHESHMEVYRWLCGMLRHSHSKVLAALTHAAQYHKALHHHTDALQNLVKRGENMQSADDSDKVIKKLSSLLKELDIQQSAIVHEVDLPILKDTFQILRTHQGPQGYGKALVVLDANKSVSLSIFGENDRQQVSDSEADIGDESDEPTSTFKRAMSLQLSRRVRDKDRPKLVPLQKSVLLKEAHSDLQLENSAMQNSVEDVPLESADDVKEDAPDSVGVTPSAPPHDDDGTEVEEATQEDEEPITDPETPIPKILPITPEVVTLPREGTFGRQTVNVSYRRYPPHLYDEEPIIESVTHLNNSHSQREPEEPPDVDEISIVKEREIEVTPLPSVSRRHRSHREEVVVLEEPVTSRDRARPRKKRGKKRPTHNTGRRADDGDIRPKQHGRRQSRQRRKAPAKRSRSSSKCRIS